jgi:outer membrane biosynthesis protein TonB
MSTFRPATRRIYPRRYRLGQREERRYRLGRREGRSYRLGRREEIHATREADRSNLRGIVIAALLCSTVFAGAFALGRDGRTASGPREAAPWTFPAVSAGAAIPVHLAGAPPITVEAPSPKARTNTRSQAAAGRVVTSPAVATQPLAEGNAPVTPAAPTPPPTVTHSEPATPPPAPAPAATPRPSPSAPAARKSSGAPAPAEPGKSFESSG